MVMTGGQAILLLLFDVVMQWDADWSRVNDMMLHGLRAARLRSVGELSF